MATLAEINIKGFEPRLVWASRDTRWDVYPQREPVQLALHNYQGWWLPQPDGSWFKSPTSFDVIAEAYAPDLRGEWREEFVTKYFGKDLTIKKFVRLSVSA